MISTIENIIEMTLLSNLNALDFYHECVLQATCTTWYSVCLYVGPDRVDHSMQETLGDNNLYYLSKGYVLILQGVVPNNDEW